MTEPFSYEILEYKLHKHGVEEKFILATRSATKLRFKKVQFLRTVVEVEDDKSWRPPLFLIGIALALLYQCFMRSNKNEPTGLSKGVKKGLISKEMNKLHNLGRKLNNY